MNLRIFIFHLVAFVVLMFDCNLTFAEKDKTLPGMQSLLLRQSPLTTTTYCHGEFNKIIIESGKEGESYKIVLRVLSSAPVPAIGTRVGNTLSLKATIQDFTLSYSFTLLNDDQNITGKIVLTDGNQGYTWNEWGVRGSCPTNDVAADGVPQFINSDFVSLSEIEDISLFRSAAGHDYSDEFESCRSMKHYYSPPLAIRTNDTVSIFSPVTGRIAHLDTEEENFLDDGKTNQKIVIWPDNQPAIMILLFHVDLLDPTLTVGFSLSAGQHLGYGRLVRNSGPPSHDFDIALHANTSTGIRYVSYFEAMTNALFNGYAIWGGGTALRQNFIISETARNADPLTCSGETFTSSGSLPSWYYNLP